MLWLWFDPIAESTIGTHSFNIFVTVSDVPNAPYILPVQIDVLPCKVNNFWLGSVNWDNVGVELGVNKTYSLPELHWEPKC